MKAQFIPDQITKLTADEAIEALRIGFHEVVGHWPENKALALTVAQSALETGRWKSMHCYNWGNVKASQSYEGFYTQFRCNEIIKGKVEWFDPPHPQTNFRAYESAAVGAADHMDFLSTRKRYAAAWAAKLTGDPVAFVTELKRAGYFTANEVPYRKAVVSLFSEFLFKIEKLPPTTSVPARVEPADEEHSTITPQDLNILLPVLAVDWDELRKDRDELIASMGHDTEPAMPAVRE